MVCTYFFWFAVNSLCEGISRALCACLADMVLIGKSEEVGNLLGGVWPICLASRSGDFGCLIKPLSFWKFYEFLTYVFDR